MGVFGWIDKREVEDLWRWGYLYLSDNHWYNFKASLGEGTNKFVALSAVRLLIRLAVEKEVK